MEWAPWVTGTQCQLCSQSYSIDESWCSACDSPVIHQYEDATLTDTWADAPDVFAQFRPLLPIADGLDNDRAVGNTPLCESEWLASELTVDRALIKDEGRNPTGHIADRDMVVLAAAIPSETQSTLALASPGRSGIAAASAAVARGHTSQVFVPSRAPFGAKALINVHDGSMRVVPGRFPDAMGAFRDGHESAEWIIADPIESPLCHAGRKTVYFELIGQLGGQAPDVLVVPTGMGASIRAVCTAATEAISVGLADTIPRLILAQPAGCAPFVDPIMDGSPMSDWSNPDTIVGELEIPAPTAASATLQLLEQFDVEAVAVPDSATLEAAVQTAQCDGLQVSVAGGVGLAGVTAVADIEPGDTVVVLNPGTGVLDADILRSHLMGQGI